MKKKSLNKKLSLNKQTVANLSNNRMNSIKGGLDAHIEPAGTGDCFSGDGRTLCDTVGNCSDNYCEAFASEYDGTFC